MMEQNLLSAHPVRVSIEVLNCVLQNEVVVDDEFQVGSDYEGENGFISNQDSYNKNCVVFHLNICSILGVEKDGELGVPSAMK